MSVEVDIDVGLLKSEIKKTYASVSERPTHDFIFPTGRAWAEYLDYPPELAAVPDTAAESLPASRTRGHSVGWPRASGYSISARVPAPTL